MNATSTIKKLNKYEFHDLVIESIELIDNNGFQLTLIAQIFNETNKQYQNLTLIFSEIFEISPSNLDIYVSTDLELYSFKYNYENYYQCELIFLLGSGNPSLSIDLKCHKIDFL